MKQFLKKLIVFIIPLFLAFGTTELVLRTVPNEYSTKIHNFKERLPEIELLILGSSHALRGINPHEFRDQKAYSLAMVAQALQMDHDILFRYEEKMPKLKTVIISISHFSLTKKLNEGELAGRLPFYKFFFHLKYDQLSPLSIEYYSLQASIGFRTSFYKIYKYLKKGHKDIRCDTLGWMGDGGKAFFNKKQFIKDAMAAVKRHEDGLYDFSTNIELIKEIIRWSEKEKVRVIFVNTPKTEWYNRSIDQKKSQMIKKVMLELTVGLENVQYLDFKDHPKFELSDFRNSDHVNLEGAKKLTKLLSHYIQ